MTPGSGSEVIHKDSVFVENTCSPSLSLSPNSVVQTKGATISKCGSADKALGADRSIKKEKLRPSLKSDFSLVDDSNFETLDKRLASSQGFNEACDAAEALTASIFNVGKPSSENKISGLYDDANCHESTVKCNKWLSDNTKSAVVADHCYSSLESTGREREKTKKKLPRVKSIEKTNLKIVRSNSTCSEASSFTGALILNDFDNKDEENKIPTMDGSFPIDSSYEAPSFVETCVTVPWNTEYLQPKNETIVRIDPKPEPVVDKSPVVLIQIKAKDLEGIRGRKIVQTPKNPDIQARRKSDHKLKPEPVVDNQYVGTKLEDSEDTRVQSAQKKGNTERGHVANEKKIEALASSDIRGAKPCSTSDNNQMKKPQKRAFPKTAKYQGFNFGSLKKKSKRNSSNGEESIKSSLPNLPSPDNASTCSDATCGSECSYTTATTADSKLDGNSKSSLDGEEVSLASSSDAKTISGPQTESISDASLNLDLQVLDELMLCDDVDLPQGFNDDWLVSLFE